MRSVTHAGLAVVLLVTPALCCCNTRLLARAADAVVSGKQSCCHQSCCHAATARPVTKSCCGTVAKPSPAPVMPADPAPPKCACCVERPDPALPEQAPPVPAPGPTGELVAFAAPSAAFPEHLDPAGDALSPYRLGVDTRHEARASRHVLRC